MEHIAWTPSDLLAMDRPTEQDLLEISLAMPAWLSNASDATREAYVQQLMAYHAAADRLETQLSEALPTFGAFVREQLAARILADLGATLEPDAVTIELPKRVWRDYTIDPQFGRVTNYNAPWVASDARETFSLPELTLRNFLADDEQMARRFDFARIEQDSAAPVEGLTAGYLHRIIPQLDVAQGYRSKVRALFCVPTMTSEQAQREADLLLEPFERQIQLQALCAVGRRDLSAQGLQMLTLAAQARSHAETGAANLDMHWLAFKPGTSVSGEHEGHTLSGLCLIRDRGSDHCVIYLPDAPVDLLFIEASSLEHARSRLMSKLLGAPDLIDYMAARTLDAAHIDQHVHYIHQALARGFEGFIQFVPALDLQLAAQQLHARAWSLQQLTLETAQSKTDLTLARNRQQSDMYLMYFRVLLGLLPGIGTLISIEDGWRDGHDAYQAFKDGRGDDGVLALGSTAFSLLDVSLSLVPGVASVCLLSRFARGRRVLRAAVPSTPRHIIRPFEGYEVSTSLTGAVAQSGRDAGTWLKDGQLWVQREGQVYAVYRRSGELTLRLKKTPHRGYEPPVRMEQGEWVYHSDVGLKGGVRSTIAETLIANAHGDPAFKPRHARQLLDQFEFPPDRQRRLELDIATHYQQHREVPEWAQAYRRPEPQPEPSPQPGPSGNKRKDPPSTEAEAGRQPPPEPASGSVLPSTPGVADVADTWKGWGRSLVGTDPQPLGTHPPVFHMRSEPDSHFIQMDGMRYDILPSGASQHPTIVFLKNPSTRDDSFTGFNHILQVSRHEQPIMASFEAGKWTVHGPMFKRKLQLLVEQARPGFTALTNRVLAEKLFEAADPAHAGLTGSRLINLRATLNAWQTGGIAPLPGLQDPLSLLEAAPVTGLGTLAPRVRLSYGPARQPFNRLDFVFNNSELRAQLRQVMTSTHLGSEAKDNLHRFMSSLLTQSGYTIIDGESELLRLHSVLLFRRPGHEALYMARLAHFSIPYAGLHINQAGGAVPMSNRWIDEWLATRPTSSALLAIVEARSQGRLVKLIGGVKPTSSVEPLPQVLLQRMSSEF